MSLLAKALEKRIQELRITLEAQKTELAAYQQVLSLESRTSKSPRAETQSNISPSSSALVAAPDFKGNRSDFVAAILKSRGADGATPAEISQVFAQRKIKFSKNLIYNVVSLLFKKNTLRKEDGRYYYRAANSPKQPLKKG